MVSAFKECKEKDDPMVVIFHNFVSGEDPIYMEAFEKFIDYAVSENATFVSTNELIELTKNKRIH